MSRRLRTREVRALVQTGSPVHRVCSEGVIAYDTDEDSNGDSGPPAPPSLPSALTRLSIGQRQQLRSEAKARRQLHLKVRKHKRYVDYFKSCQQSLVSKLTSNEGKAFVRKAAADEKRSVAQIVERMVKSLEAQSVQQYAKMYKQKLSQNSPTSNDLGASSTGTHPCLASVAASAQSRDQSQIAADEAQRMQAYALEHVAI